MQVRLRLNELLERHNVSGHGRIALVSNATGIERHKLSRLLEGGEDKVSLRQLAALCRFLIEHCRVDPKELPGALFSLEPSRFLALLRSTPSLRTCFGVRQQRGPEHSPWAAGADAFLHGKMLELLLRPPAFDPVSTEEHAASGPTAETSIIDTGYSEIRHFHQEQVHAASVERVNGTEFRDQELADLHDDATRVYADLCEEIAGRMLLILGSVKSNPVCELSIARIFSADPWTEHGLALAAMRTRKSGQLVLPDDPAERAVPFFIRYRDGDNGGWRDPHIPSCYAGLQLAARKVKCGRNSSRPGIYYETPDGWEAVEWKADGDAAIVLYEYDKLKGNVEVVMGGF
ncbi:MAG: helix-turn-helix transcriptional regulator, partial [Planctomycetaceae bacterium]|nr:helix-turn-helix transcriptional regulator [Planctomycetaceae bacterium]